MSFWVVCIEAYRVDFVTPSRCNFYITSLSSLKVLDGENTDVNDSTRDKIDMQGSYDNEMMGGSDGTYVCMYIYTSMINYVCMFIYTSLMIMK
jgi:hypothetical protein